MTTDADLARLITRVDGLVQQATALTDQVNRLTSTMETRYLPREVYEGNRHADRDDVKDVREQLDKAQREREAERRTLDERRAADRRLIIFSLAVPFLLILFQIYANSRGLSGG